MKEALKKIVRESIYDVICIDDDYVNPYDMAKYDNLSKKKKTAFLEKCNFSGKMYDSMGKICEGNITIFPYNSKVKITEVKAKFRKKDLLVLDWELSVPQNIAKTMKVLEEAIKSSLQYICIYTYDTDIASIKECICRYYRGFTKKDMEGIRNSATTMGIYEMRFYDQLKNFYESPTRKLKGIRRLLEEDEIEYKKTIFDVESDLACENWVKLFLAWDNAIMPSKSCKRRVNIISEHVIRVDEKYIFLFNKEGSGDGDNTMGPDKIIPSIAAAIVETPSNSPLNGIWLHYTNELLKAIILDGNYFENISWETFAYYANKLSEEYSDEETAEFMKDIFIKRIAQIMETKNVSLPEVIMTELKNIGVLIKVDESNKKDFYKLNEVLNINSSLSSTKHSITFGDVLWNQNDDMFYLCISAKCDCAVRRDTPAPTDFLFVRGKKWDSMQALKDAESQCVSFIEISENMKNCIPVKWEKTIWPIRLLNTSMERGKNYWGSSYGERKKYEYVCNISDEYSQRMANMAYSNSNRVGVCFAKKS